MNPLVKEGLILFLSLGLVILIIFLTIVGLIRTQNFIEYRSEYYNSQPQKGSLKIDFINLHQSLSSPSVVEWVTGKGHIINNPKFKFSISLLNFERDQLESEVTWEKYLIRNDSIFSVWYNTTGWLNIEETESIEKLKVKIKNKIKKLFLSTLVWFIPLFLYGIFFIFNKKQKGIITIFFIFLYISMTSIQGQSLIYDYDVIIEKNTEIQSSVYIYDTPFQAKYRNIPESDFKYQYPEEFLIGYASATSNEWMKSLLLDTTSYKEYSDNIFEIIKQGEGPEFHLVAKLNFVVDEEQFALMKFRLYAPGFSEPPVGAYLLQKKEGRWYYRQDNIFTNLTFAFMMIKNHVFKNMIEGTTRNGSKEAKVVASFGLRSRIDPIRLGDEFWSSFQPNSDAESFPESLLETTNW